ARTLIAVNHRADGARDGPGRAAPRRGAGARARAAALALLLAGQGIGVALPASAAQDPARRPQAVQGSVVRVLDGDSLLMRAAGGELRGVRIAGIDAPEKGQPHA